MNTNYAVTVIQDPEGFVYAEIPDLVGCSATGKTVEEALKNVEKEKKRWLRDAKRRGMKVPAPDYERTYSGRFVLRVDPALHEDLSKRAKREGISLNQYVLKLITAGEYTIDQEEVLGKLDRIERLCSGTHSTTVSQARAIESLTKNRVFMAMNIEDVEPADIIGDESWEQVPPQIEIGGKNA